MKKPSWNELLMFVTLAEQKSFRRAAELLGMKPSTLSHSLKGLEELLKLRLFQRTTRSVSLTEVGQQFYLKVLPLLHDMDEAISSITAMGNMPSGMLRINGGDEAVSLLIAQVLPNFMHQYPGIELDFIVDNTLSDIVKDGFDAGIRLYEDIPQDMVAVRISGEIRFLTVASPDYLRASPLLCVPEDLLKHRCIRHRLPSGKLYAWEYSKGDSALTLDVPGQMTLNNSRLMLEAARSGQGIVYVPDLYIRQFLDDGTLINVLEEYSVKSPGLFLYYPYNRHMSFAMTVFIEAIKASQSTKQPFIE